MNAVFQRIAKRDKRAFLSEQCKEIEKNNRMEMTKDLKQTNKQTNTYNARDLETGYMKKGGR